MEVEIIDDIEVDEWKPGLAILHSFSLKDKKSKFREIPSCDTIPYVEVKGAIPDDNDVILTENFDTNTSEIVDLNIDPLDIENTMIVPSTFNKEIPKIQNHKYKKQGTKSIQYGIIGKEKVNEFVNLCPYCNKKFGKSNGLHRHMMIVHREESIILFKCHMCDNAFTQSGKN